MAMFWQKMQKKAFRGSDYSSGGFGAEDVILLLFLLLLFLPSVFGIIYVIIELIRGRKYRKSLFGERKITGWFRDAPLDGDLLSAAYVLKHGNRFGGTVNVSNLIGAFFLRWIMNSIVTLQPDSRNAKRSRRGGSGRGGRNITIRKGQTLSQIAKANGTTVAKLKRLNGIKGNNIRAGKKLRVK